MSKVTRFEDFKVWNDARILSREIYRISSTGSLSADWGLRDQLRKAAISIVSNIAEGFERGGDQEFKQYVSMAKGSAGEVRAQLLVCSDLGYIDDETLSPLLERAEEISKQLAGLLKYLKSSKLRGSKFKEKSNSAHG